MVSPSENRGSGIIAQPLAVLDSKQSKPAPNSTEAKASVAGQETLSKIQKEPKKEQLDTTKCWQCNRKVGLLGFKCKCAYTFCSKHRHDTEHACDFDYKAQGRAEVAKNNPLIVKDKIIRI
jgi:AN1-type zinc finger protein 5/6